MTTGITSSRNRPSTPSAAPYRIISLSTIRRQATRQAIISWPHVVPSAKAQTKNPGFFIDLQPFADIQPQ
ncbi:MAG: hypothetical protein JST22_20220 [Bacteroidetes bacterium]|nr:hypothetical protein [Bacteroidota bacterium]